MHVTKVAVGHHAFQITPWDRDDKGRGTRGNQQLVIGNFTVFADDNFAHPVNAGNPFAKTAINARRVIPLRIMGNDFLVGFVARQNRRQHDAVIIPARFRPEKGDVIKFIISLKQVLHSASRRHASPDNNEFKWHYAASFFVWPCS